MTPAKTGIMTACVIGDPVGHSLSPLLHETWIRAMGLNARYVRCHSTQDAFRQTVMAQFSKPGFIGMNVTLPHKVAALALAEHASKTAQKAGAANLLYIKNNRLYADNTDIEGLVAPLLTAHPANHWRKSKIVIIGAGGAARAALVGALKLKPASVVVLNRTDARAKTLAKRFGDPVCARPWQGRDQALSNARLLINASAAGMNGQTRLAVSLQGLGREALVYDLIYTPLFTPLLEQAAECGFEGLNGLDMLIAQARPSFEVFYGVSPPKGIDVRSILVRALGGGV